MQEDRTPAIETPYRQAITMDTCTSDAHTRLTDMQVGVLRACYADGSRIEEPLIYGRNMDCMMKPFATGVVSYKLKDHCHLSAFTLKTDPTRTLEGFEAELFAADCCLGILALNVVE
jgi:hypothetical protein